MSTASIVELKNSLGRYKNMAANARESGKALMMILATKAVGGGVAAGLALLDEEKGDIKKGNLTGIRYHSVGPVPTSLIAGGLGSIAQLVMMGDPMGQIAGAVADAGLYIGEYIGVRQMWANHKANAGKK